MSDTDTSVFQGTPPAGSGSMPGSGGSPEAATTGGYGTTSGSADTGSSAPVMEQAKQQAQKVVEQTQQKAGEVLDQAKNQTKSWAEERKQAMAQSLSTVADAVMQTSESLRGQGSDTGKVADFTDRAAEYADKAAGYLRDTSVDQMIGQVEDFGRREPVMFLVGAAALGFLAARFLKSSSRSVQGVYSYNPDRRLPVPVDEQNRGVGTNYDATTPAG